MRPVLALVSAEAFDTLLVGIHGVRERDISGLVRYIHEGQRRALLGDDQASILYGAVEMRNRVFAARRRAAANERVRAKDDLLYRVDDRDRRRAKRRVWSGSGALPHELRASFTHGENAVAAVIRAEVRKRGSCALAWSTIAKAAGLAGVTVVKRFVRLAKRMMLISVDERRVRGGRSRPNIIRVISVAWLNWINCETLRSSERKRGHDHTSLQIKETKSPLSHAASTSGSEALEGCSRDRPRVTMRC